MCVWILPALHAVRTLSEEHRINLDSSSVSQSVRQLGEVKTLQEEANFQGLTRALDLIWDGHVCGAEGGRRGDSEQAFLKCQETLDVLSGRETSTPTAWLKSRRTYWPPEALLQTVGNRMWPSLGQWGPPRCPPTWPARQSEEKERTDKKINSGSQYGGCGFIAGLKKIIILFLIYSKVGKMICNLFAFSSENIFVSRGAPKNDQAEF